VWVSRRDLARVAARTMCIISEQWHEHCDGTMSHPMAYSWTRRFVTLLKVIDCMLRLSSPGYIVVPGSRRASFPSLDQFKRFALWTVLCLFLYARVIMGDVDLLRLWACVFAVMHLSLCQLDVLPPSPAGIMPNPSDLYNGAGDNNFAWFNQADYARLLSGHHGHPKACTALVRNVATVLAIFK
jgi:hypothetical protein